MKIPQQDIFDQTNDRALAAYPGLLQEWIPGGKVIGHEYKALNPTRADQTIGSFSINVHNGKWLDGATGDEGGDPISLYAYLKFGGVKNRVQACKELSAKFGLEDTAPKARPHLRVVKPEPEEEWKPQVPPPDDVSEPTAILAKWDHVFRYVDPHGHLLRYVLRNEKTARRSKKEILPLTYGYLKDKNHAQGETGWHLKHPDKPRGLYGLDRLDGRDVLLQEGELKTDLAALNLPQYACLSLTGGSAGALHNDLEPLRGRRVILCPDQDFPGRKGATQVAELLRAIGCTVTLIDMTDMPEKWDLGNAVTGKQDGYPDQEPWNGERLEEFLKARSVPSFDEPDADPEGSLDLEPPDMGEWKEDGGSDDKRLKPPIPLGYDSGHYYYLSPMTGQIEVLARKSHTKQELIGIASLQWYNTLEKFKGDKGGLDWDRIGDMLKGWCSDVGFFNPDRTRGRGAWMDEDRAVLNLGDRLLMAGESLPLILPGSTYIYEAAPRLRYAVAEPLTKEQAGELAELCKLFRWEKSIFGTLMAGWLVVAPICGALPWRPAIWVTGGSGSGKSTLERLIVKPLLGGIGLFLKGGSTEAGIRQRLNRDARPVIFDEAEAESPKSKGIIQGLLELNRQSSSEGGAEILKGSQNQTGAKRYHVRSCFMFSSINPTLDYLADESRITVLELQNPRSQKPDDFDVLVDRAHRITTPEFCAGFVARSVLMMPTILANAETFARVLAAYLGSSRVGDQIGTLLAGAFSLTSDRIVSPEAARLWVEGQEWADTTSADAAPDERKMLDFLMQQMAELNLGNRTEKLMLGEIVKLASGENGAAVAAFANSELKRHGIAWDDAENGVWIANDHAQLKKHLKDTPWSSKWERTLRRLPGSRPRLRTEAAISFSGTRQRATFVPMELIG
jgi:putative DNA primase/helicase